jgi:hypothetical protein
MRVWGAGVAAGHVVLGVIAVAVLGIPGAELFFGLCAVSTLVLSQLAAPLLRPRGDDSDDGGDAGRGPDDDLPPWWPDFERDLRAYLEASDRDRAPSA